MNVAPCIRHLLGISSPAGGDEAYLRLNLSRSSSICWGVVSLTLTPMLPVSFRTRSLPSLWQD